MFDEKVIITEQFPVSDSNRRQTDVCCTFIGVAFAITMLIAAILSMNPDAYNRQFNMQNQNLCTSGYMHYVDIDDLESRICVNACPSGYGVTVDNICIPYDEQLQEKYFRNTNFMRASDFEGFRKTLSCAMLVSLGVGIMWMVLVLAIPNNAPFIATTGAGIALIFVAVFSGFSGQNFWGGAIVYKILVIVICLILLMVAGAFSCSYEGELRFQAVILRYAKVFLIQNAWNFVYIPLFLLFTHGLVVLILFQHWCFASSFATNGNPVRMTNGGVWGVFNILEFIWGLQFLRDSYNFLLSGSAVQWYWTSRTSCCKQFSRLVCKHWGSVVAGSLLNAFFQIPTLIVQALVCHPAACCSKAGSICENSCNPFTCFFDLIRTDAYSYINLSGIPFCNSARNCNHLCKKSSQYLGNHTSIKHYRFMAHVFLVALVAFMTQFILNYRMYWIGFWHLSFGVILIYSIVTWFIDIQTAPGEGLQISYLAELELEQNYKYMRKIRPVILLFTFLEFQRRLVFPGCTAKARWKLLNHQIESDVWLIQLSHIFFKVQPAETEMYLIFSNAYAWLIIEQNFITSKA